MNTQINITKNGTTTLATAGKYCDRNIDVNVTVPTYEDEVAEQKAISDSIADRTITEFASDTLQKLDAFSFYYCASLHTINCPSVWAIYTRALGYTALKRVDFPGLVSINNLAFEYSKLETLIIRTTSVVCKLGNTNAFTSTPIAKGTGYIYVPDNLVESYKTATNWATYASQIKSISELEE